MPICLISVPPAVRYELLVLALIGTVSSTVFLALVLLPRGSFRKSADGASRAAESCPSSFPRSRFSSPFAGWSRSWSGISQVSLNSTIPDYEIVFGCRTPDDPALSRG